MAISTLDEYLATIPNDDNRARMVDVLVWVGLTYPELELRIAWYQPMFIHHELAEKQDITSFWRPKEHELAAAEAVANGAQPPTVRERTADDGELEDSFLEEFLRYADNPTPGHPLEQLNEELKQAVRDYEEHPDDVYTLDEVKADLGLD